MTLKTYIRRQLDKGMTVEQAWRAAEKDRWHVAWNYVVKVARDWQREKESTAATQSLP